MQRQHNRHHARLKRHRRLRNRLAGTPARPRLNVFRSSAHISAQLIDDEAGRTLVAASSNERGLREQLAGEQPTTAAATVSMAGSRPWLTEAGPADLTFSTSPNLSGASHGAIQTKRARARPGFRRRT